MFKVGSLVAKSTLSKLSIGKSVSTAGKSVGSVVAKTTLGAVKLPFSSLLKMSSSIVPMMGSAVLGGLFLLFKLMQ